MEDLLQDLVGTPVDLWSGAGDSEHMDHGMLEAVDDRWVRLREGDTVLCFPIANVRLVKGRPQRKVGLPRPAGVPEG